MFTGSVVIPCSAATMSFSSVTFASSVSSINTYASQEVFLEYTKEATTLVSIDTPLDCGTFEVSWTFNKDGGAETTLVYSPIFNLATGVDNEQIWAYSEDNADIGVYVLSY